MKSMLNIRGVSIQIKDIIIAINGGDGMLLSFVVVDATAATDRVTRPFSF